MQVYFGAPIKSVFCSDFVIKYQEKVAINGDKSLMVI